MGVFHADSNPYLAGYFMFHTPQSEFHEGKTVDPASICLVKLF